MAASDFIPTAVPVIRFGYLIVAGSLSLEPCGSLCPPTDYRDDVCSAEKVIEGASAVRYFDLIGQVVRVEVWGRVAGGRVKFC